MKIKTRNAIIIGICLLAIIVSFFAQIKVTNEQKEDIENPKLYWFIPDGLRAEPYTFTIYKWAEEGKMPNLKKLMEMGSYGYCKPVYPGHTPVNFATLFTGCYPEVHGVADGPMHTEGNPLTRPSVAGFSSTAKKVEPIWVTLEGQGRTVALLSIPGSTPPELSQGYTMVGRWGGWGASFYPVNFEDSIDSSKRKKRGRAARLFFFGPPLAVYPEAKEITAPEVEHVSYSPPKGLDLSAWGAKTKGLIVDATDDEAVNYDTVIVYDDTGKLATLKKGQWSEWIDVSLKWNDLAIETQAKVKVIRLGENGSFRIRAYYNAMNETLTQPAYLSSDIIENIGPMVDYVDNFPPQLIFYQEDKDTFLEESAMSFEWHREIVAYFLDKYDPDIFIQDIYSPNQMLTSRWWMGYVDPDSPRYSDKSDEERQQLWREVQDMYKKIDDILGEYIENADENTVIVFTSDHGAAPLFKWVNLNNLFARRGWLNFTIDPVTGEPDIDWRSSKVVYLKFGQVFINPAGLHSEDGKWYRASGSLYEKLREEVRIALLQLEDEGVKPVMQLSTWEDAEGQFRLPPERVGDLIISNRPGYGWNEEMTEDLALYSEPLKTGYKQAIISDNYPAMWVPFVVAGPGVKKSNFLGDKPYEMIDQYPTIMKLIGAKSPSFVQGKPIRSVFDNTE